MQMNPFPSPQATTLTAPLLLVGMHQPHPLLLMLCVRRLASVAHVSVILKRMRLSRLPAPSLQKPPVSNARPQATPLVLHTRSSLTWSVMMVLATVGHCLHRRLLPSLHLMTMRRCRPWPTPIIRCTLQSF